MASPSTLQLSHTSLSRAEPTRRAKARGLATGWGLLLAAATSVALWLAVVIALSAGPALVGL